MRRFNDVRTGGYRKPQHRGWTPRRVFEKFDPRVDNSEDIRKSFINRTVKAEYGEDPERLVRRFKRVVEASGVLSELKKRAFYKSPGQLAREAELKALKNIKKKKARAEKFQDYDSKRINPRPNSGRGEQGNRPPRA